MTRKVYFSMLRAGSDLAPAGDVRSRRAFASTLIVWSLLAAVTVSLGAVTGCFRTSLPMTGDPGLDLRCDDALVVQRATRLAAEKQDPAAIPHLIFNLRSDNSWVRMMSLQALQKIRGAEVSYGYSYFAPAADREKAVAAWERWYDRELRSAEPAQ